MDTNTFAANLAQFTGTSQYYRHMGTVVLTDGAKFFADTAGAYWFMDILATEPEVVKQGRQFAAITLKVEDSEAVITATDGNENKVWEQHINYTTCPEGEWKFYIVDGVVMLTSEY